ncbi:Aerobic-type carbon monoxide dehydrogenase FAD-binding subunit [Cupriavidus taiwanensis]|uniref:FAD binding domain-containing protein n=1 Tax=Cupriavidus taiwanensis TaxID=164546 RepID=UPI000E10A2D2|nr:FAD binding domain-containing protein [Cupriavidus taiwanensis]SPA42131.1 Aerobic-type carbon monoxide dehydrogenase FAD-binding subunit [Cupriavidus taiwanensis]
MKAVAFCYYAPGSLPEALSRLGAGTDVSKAMGGGQSLGPMLNLRLTRPDTVVDVSALRELRDVSATADGIRIGACVTHAQIEDGVFESLRGTMLQAVAGGIAYRAIRNRGTVGGSLAHADPAADWIVAMTALGAHIEIASAAGTRDVPMESFMLGAYTTILADGELIAAVRVPPKTAHTRWGYQKLCRKTGEFAEASCAAYFDASRRFARIVLGALDGPPMVLPGLTRAVAAQGAAALTADAVAEAVAQAAPGKDAIDRKLYRTVVTRCVAQLLN